MIIIKMLSEKETAMRKNPVLNISPLRSLVRDIQPDCGYIIISSEGKCDCLSDYSNVLFLHFADTEDSRRLDAITSADVEKIYKYIKTCDFEDCFIACDAGESRSPAVAAGLLRSFDKDDSYIWKSGDYRPNVLVYKTMIELQGNYRRNDESELRKMDYMSPEEYRNCRRG